MLLRDIILEETPAEKAKKLGLERKPGFGNYGPVGKKLTTHRSRGGELVQVATDEPSAGTDTSSAIPSKNAATEPEFIPYRSSEPVKREATFTRAKFFETIDKFVEMFVEDSTHQDVVNFTTTQLGRTGPDVLINPTEELMAGSITNSVSRAIAIHAIKHGGAAGAYVRSLDAIFTEDVLYPESVRILPPYRLWSRRHVGLIHTLIHESIHAASPRLSEKDDDPAYKNDTYGLLTFYEEGVTELIAKRIVSGIVEKTGRKRELKPEVHYRELTNAMYLVEKHTRITPEELFTIKDPTEFKNKITLLLQKTRKDILMKIFSEEEYAELFSKDTIDVVDDASELYASLMLTEEIGMLLRKISDNPRLTDEEKEDFKIMIKMRMDNSLSLRRHRERKMGIK